MANDEPRAVLRQGAKAWLEWLLKNPGEVLDFSGENLSEVDLSGAKLTGADLSRARLINANLSGVHRSRANLNRAGNSRAPPTRGPMRPSKSGCARWKTSFSA
jgi:uncharacterized protein YjbI with pentapeptide repeats